MLLQPLSGPLNARRSSSPSQKLLCCGRTTLRLSVTQTRLLVLRPSPGRPTALLPSIKVSTATIAMNDDDDHSDASSDASVEALAAQLATELAADTGLSMINLWTLCVLLDASRILVLQIARMLLCIHGLPDTQAAWIHFVNQIIAVCPIIFIPGQAQGASLILQAAWSNGLVGRMAPLGKHRMLTILHPPISDDVWPQIRDTVQRTLRTTRNFVVNLRNPGGPLGWVNGPPAHILRIFVLQNGHWIRDVPRIEALLHEHAHVHLGPWHRFDAWFQRTLFFLFWLRDLNSLGRRPYIFANYFGRTGVDITGAFIYNAAICEYDLEVLRWEALPEPRPARPPLSPIHIEHIRRQLVQVFDELYPVGSGRREHFITALRVLWGHDMNTVPLGPLVDEED
ncbi:hypothetical protein OF83DRAFT_1170966 [Amylostereum chailletii]|nr:hypothetical protein OF83DRAFT_1170966 [Amylostereum chailletii]